MKRLILALFLTLTSTFGWAQKFGYIDSQDIISKMPEYKKAQTELNQFSVKWQKEIEDVQLSIDKLKQEYQAEEVLLTEDMRKERTDTIAAREKSLRELQKNYFGYKGLLFLKRQELVRPAQEKLYVAVEKVAKESKLSIIFDKSGELVMIYTNPDHDYTEDVLIALGLLDKKDILPPNNKNKP
ncbi:MAG: OmpH family outer membrane protein [Cytophagales bacterium]|nr:OmpH family outer membrane protein [Cytophaga sp.]